MDISHLGSVAGAPEVADDDRLMTTQTTYRARSARFAAGLALSTIYAFATFGARPTPRRRAAPKCFGKKPTIVGKKKKTTIKGTTGDDVIYTGKGYHEVRAGKGDDLICVGDGVEPTSTATRATTGSRAAPTATTSTAAPANDRIEHRHRPQLRRRRRPATT